MPDNLLEIEFAKATLTGIVKGNLRHRDYDRTVYLADLYKRLITGDGIDVLLRQFVRREDDKLFAQRKLMTQAITPGISASIMNPFYKVSRVNPVQKTIDFIDINNFNDKQENIAEAIGSFYGKKDLDTYLASRFTDMSFTDPNAFVLVEFDSVPLDAAGQPTGRVKPRPVEIPSFSAVNYKYKNNILQWLVVFIGDGYTLYGPNVSVRFRKVSSDVAQGEIGVLFVKGDFTYFRKNDKEAYLVEVFEHNTGQVPAVQIGYKRDLVTDSRTFVSPLHDAVPYFMKSIKTVSELDLTMALHTFPQKLQYVGRCLGESAEMGCDGGRNVTGAVCKVCGGSGIAPIQTSAQDALLLRMPKDPKDIVDLEKLMVYKSPSVELIRFQKEFIDSLKIDAQKAVFNSELFSKSEVSATATEKKINLDSVYDTLKPFADKYSDVYIDLVSIIASLRDVNDSIVIHRFPKDFKFKTMDELLQDLSTASTSNAPGYIRQEIAMDISAHQFADKPLELQRIQSKQAHYPFKDKTPDEIRFIVSNDLTTKFNEVLWANFDAIFGELEQDQEKNGFYFYDMAFGKQSELLKAKVQEYIDLIGTERPEMAIAFGNATE